MPIARCKRFVLVFRVIAYCIVLFFKQTWTVIRSFVESTICLYLYSYAIFKKKYFTVCKVITFNEGCYSSFGITRFTLTLYFPKLATTQERMASRPDGTVTFLMFSTNSGSVTKLFPPRVSEKDSEMNTRSSALDIRLNTLLRKPGRKACMETLPSLLKHN